MAFNFIKKVFSFGRKQAEENEQAAPPAEELRPQELPEQAGPGPQEPEPSASSPEPSPAPEPTEPEETPQVPHPAPPAQPPEPQPRQPQVEVATPPAEPAVEPEPAQPEIEPSASEPAPVEIPTPPATPAPSPETPTRAAVEETPHAAPTIGEADLGGVPEEQGPTVEESPSKAEPAPSAPAEEQRKSSPALGAPQEARPTEAPLPGTEPVIGLAEGRTDSGHVPIADPSHDVAPPSSSEERSIDEADRGDVGVESGALEEAPPVPELPAAGQTRDITATPAGRVTVSKKVQQKAEAAKPAEPAPRLSWFQRLKHGLSRSSRELSGNIAGVFTKRKLDEDTLQDLEDVLIRADLGVETALRVTDALASGRYGKNVSDEEVRTIMAEEVEKVLKPVALPLELDLSHKPHVILVVGVNGTGKTTTIGKLAAKLTEGGLSVTLAAGDTFRAAAIEQLKIWGERTGSPVVSSKLGADAAGLAYDAFEKAKQAGSDVLIIDTAGRLQNKAELMAELEKIVRVLGKLDPEAPHTVLQTVDATTGQNALNQVEIFRNVAGVNGLVMTKLDGTARGGILVAIAAKHKLPVYFIGVGEQVDDLEPFSASDFAKAIAGVA
ncbi:MAG TPA: signal recognition particle-docking protein FtsY [Rhizobiaceae bacterium]|nr:signal recognition particle-docking protein FtsY [Rhizobiaceae bacterium]